MGIAAFTFTKIHVERRKIVDGKVNINNDLMLKDVVERTVGLGKTKQSGADFSFSFTVQYLNEAKIAVASMQIDGDLLYIDEAAKVKELVEGWKKSKTIDKSVLREVMNTAMTKCNIEGIILSKEITLPPPVSLPKISE